MIRDTAILILNWNGYEDTLKCLDSLIPTLTPNDYLFIIDNGSKNNSAQKIREYFETNNLPFATLSSQQLNTNFNLAINFYLIKNLNNLGFGAGNNIVLKQLLVINEKFEFAWLLNNDAIVNKNTLLSLKNSISKNSNIAVVGSLILNYPNNGTIQCSGVKHYKFLGVSKLINKNLPLSQLNPEEDIKFDYLNGASLIFDIRALQQIDYFDESFFLYSEEFDLQLRLKVRNYTLKLDRNSLVYHKLSESTSKNKHLFYFYYNSSSLILCKKHFSSLHYYTSIVNLIIITFIRTFPSFKNFYWGLKGIVNGIKK